MADYLSQFTGSEIDSRLAKVPQLESGKQDTLVSGTNIKTVNGNSILGSGNLQIQTGETDVVKYTAQTLTAEQKAQARANIDAASLEDINSMDFVTAASLPTASASTIGHIYLIGPDASNNYDRYFTQQDGSSYSWVSLGSTQIDLSTYATQAEVDQLDLKKADKDTVRAYMMTDRAKYALLSVFNKVAFAFPDVSTEMEELNTALFNLDEVVGVEATYNQGKTIWDQGVSTLDDLKTDLTVKAVYGDGTKVTIQNYTLSGTLTAGTSTITVTYLGFFDTFDVTVTVYGSKMSYTLSDLRSLVGYAVNNNSETYGWVIVTNAARQMALLDYGITQMRNNDDAQSGYYPIPVPKTATKLTVTITQNTLQIGGYLMYFDGQKLKVYSSKVYSWAAGGFTDTFTQDGTQQLYYVPVSKPSTGNYPSNQPTALTINFE